MMNSKVIINPKIKKNYNFKDSIKLLNVDFAYDGKNNILENVNLTINKGDRVGIIGSTGTGKSTLLDIVMGLLQPNSGKVLIDGININSSFDRTFLNKWQSCVSHVPQNIFISDASFAENIAFGLSINQIDIDKVRECAKKAMIDDFINNSEKKYFTNLGEGGVKISGGQKQRIGIARALYKNSMVLILDEATSALDNQTEHDVMNTFQNLNSVTILIVTHRKSTIKYCDKIIELKKGTIVNS